MDFLIVGLGNPGDTYEQTRHNAGFMAIDVLAERCGAHYWKNKGGAQVAECTCAGHAVLLVKPQTFMNLSGSAVVNLASEYKLSSEHVIVVHDDLDIDSGTVRCKLGGGSAGHNGLKSITEKLQTPAYMRVRMGIGRPPGRMAAADYVLAPLKKQSFEDIEHAAQIAADAVEDIVSQGLTHAMNCYNAK